MEDEQGMLSPRAQIEVTHAMGSDGWQQVGVGLAAISSTQGGERRETAAWEGYC